MVSPVEMGSEFPLPSPSRLRADGELGWLPPCHDRAFTLSGRTAIETALKDMGGRVQKALLPAWCCGSMLQPFRAAGIEVDFYPVDWRDGLRIDPQIPADCQAVLWCNYFGYRTPYPREVLREFRRRGGVVIEDVTHSLLSEEQYHPESDYFVASLRKWGPLLCGGFCGKRGGGLSAKPTERPPREFIEKKRAAMALKAEYLADGEAGKKQRFLGLFREADRWLARNCSGMAMDEASMEMLTGWNVKEMRRRRRSNARIIHKGLEGAGILRPLFPLREMDCPLFVPVAVEADRRDELRRRLTDQGIYCPVHWPRPTAACHSNLYELELSLVCDQRYGPEDMRRMMRVIREP